MKKLKFIIVSLIFLSSCASTREYKKYGSSFLGKTEADLIASWGLPSKTNDSRDGGKELYYQYLDPVSKFDPIIQGPELELHWGLGFEDMHRLNLSRNWCQTIFYVNKNNKITDWIFRGNTCLVP